MICWIDLIIVFCSFGLKGAEWNVRLVNDGPIRSLHGADGLFPVLKEGKAVLKGLVMSMDHMSSNAGAGMQHLVCALATTISPIHVVCFVVV